MINRENLIKIGRAGGNTSNRETPDQIGRVGMSVLFFSRLCKTSSFKLTQKCKPRATIYFQKCKVHVSIIEDSSEEVLAVYFLWDKRL